jgi:hypothetical protein
MLVGVKTTMAFAILSRTHNHQAKMLCWVKCGPFPGQFEHRTGFVLDQITASSRAVLVVEHAHCSFSEVLAFFACIGSILQTSFAIKKNHLESGAFDSMEQQKYCI